MSTQSGTPASAASGQQQQSSQAATPANPWEGVDLNDLPDDVRTKLEAAKTAFEANQTKATELEQKLTAATDFARLNQSRADKAVSVLQKHNIPLDGNPNAAQLTDADILKEKLIKDGLKPEVAEGYAKMLDTNNGIQRERLLQELGPLAHTVAGMQANQLLSDAKSANQQLFAIPEIAKNINDNVQTLLAQGTPIDQKTMDHLLDMAYGQHVRKNPTVNFNQQQQAPNFGGSISTGVLPNQPQQQATNGAPQFKHASSIPIVSAITAEMNRGLKGKGGK